MSGFKIEIEVEFNLDEFELEGIAGWCWRKHLLHKEGKSPEDREAAIRYGLAYTEITTQTPMESAERCINDIIQDITYTTLNDRFY